MAVKEEFNYESESKIEHYYAPQSVAFYFQRLYKPLFIFIVWLIVWRLLLLWDITEFFQWGFFSIMTKVAAYFMIFMIGYRSGQSGKLLNAIILGASFGLVFGIFDAGTYYFYSRFTDITISEKLTVLQYIFIPINQAIFSAIFALVGFAIKR